MPGTIAPSQRPVGPDRSSIMEKHEPPVRSAADWRISDVKITPGNLEVKDGCGLAGFYRGSQCAGQGARQFRKQVCLANLVFFIYGRQADIEKLRGAEV